MKDVILKVIKTDIDCAIDWTNILASELAEMMTAFNEWKDFETESVVNADGKTHSYIYHGGIYSLDTLFLYWHKNIWKK
jgi:hypothetical protein